MKRSKFWSVVPIVVNVVMIFYVVFNFIYNEYYKDWFMTVVDGFFVSLFTVWLYRDMKRYLLGDKVEKKNPFKLLDEENW